MNNLEAKQQEQLNSKWAKIAGLMKVQTVYKYLASAIVAVNLFIATRFGMYFIGGMLVLHGYIDVASLLVFITQCQLVNSGGV